LLSDSDLVAWLQSHNGTVAVSANTLENEIFELGLATETSRVLWKKQNGLPAEVLSWLESENSKACFNLKQWYHFANRNGLRISGFDYDTLMMAYLTDPLKRNYELYEIAQELLGSNYAKPDDDTLIEERDLSLEAWLIANLTPKLHGQLEQENHLGIYAEIELPNTRVLSQMEIHGIQVNQEKLQKLFDDLGSSVEKITAECFAIIGKEINLASPKQLQTVLFEDLGMTGTKSVKTGFSTNAEALTTLYEQTQHPFLEKLLEHREVSKTRQMVEVLLKSIGPDKRIHTTYNQTVAATGRLSSENPNLQNIPIRGERGPEIRAAFEVSGEFETLLTADYSQIEMRIMAHLSDDESLIEAFRNGEDLHRFVGARLFGVEPDQVTSDMRSKVKAMSYGLVYGLSEYGLAKQLRISNAEAKKLMNDYFDRFGAVKRYLSKVVDHAKTDGYTVTISGRRRPFSDLNSKIFQIRENARRAALNAPIQGTAADIIKIAMNRIDQAMKQQNLRSRMLLQVHDELVFEVSKGELEVLTNIVEQQMANALELSLPLETHVGVGHNWDAAGH
jgi:DNA polymerase-1